MYGLFSLWLLKYCCLVSGAVKIEHRIVRFRLLEMFFKENGMGVFVHMMLLPLISNLTPMSRVLLLIDLTLLRIKESIETTFEKIEGTVLL